MLHSPHSHLSPSNPLNGRLPRDNGVHIHSQSVDTGENFIDGTNIAAEIEDDSPELRDNRVTGNTHQPWKCYMHSTARILILTQPHQLISHVCIVRETDGMPGSGERSNKHDNEKPRTNAEQRDERERRMREQTVQLDIS